MGNGIRVSQAGIPVASAADYQKNMDERWPLLEFYFMDVIDVTLSSNVTGAKENPGGTIAYVPIFEHNLGFLPGFRAINIGTTGINNFNQPLEDSMYADEKYIYVEVFKSAGVITIHFKLWLAVCPRDLNQTFLAPVETATAGMVASPSQYGLKVIQRGNIDSRNKDEFTLNTNGKSMNIQMHGVVTANASGYLILDHNLSYPPSFYMARKAAATGAVNPMLGKTLIEMLGRTNGLASSTAVRLTIRGAQSALTGDFVYVVLKDPVDTAR